MIKPQLNILPKPQQTLWPQLIAIPDEFILYGGTAIAIQLGHRLSVDFDFFSASQLDKNKLLSTATFLQNCTIVQPEINTLNCYLPIAGGEVKLQFLAGIQQRQGMVESPIICHDNNLYIASIRDLFATKLNTIQSRAEIKDYLDIDAILQAGYTLADGLGCAQAIYGPSFDPGTSLRALCSYRDGDLAQLEHAIQKRLQNSAITIENIPDVSLWSTQITRQKMVS